MKNLITLLMIALFSSYAFADIAPVNRSTSFDNTDTVYPGSVEKRFINVKNTNGGALVAGQVVAWDLTEDDGYSVATTSLEGASAACVLTKACAAGAVCKNCQTWGLASVAFDVSEGSAVAGLPLFLSVANPGYASASSSPGVEYQPFGVYLDAAAASGSVEAMLRL